MSNNNLLSTSYQGLVSSARMSVATNVRKFRNRKGLSQEELAKTIGVRQNTIVAIESGATRKSKYLPDIANALGVELTELDPELGPNENLIIAGKELIGDLDLPVYASTDAGDGIVFMSSEPVQTVRRPDPLATVKGGFGVIVAGESMSPIIRQGDIALIHPHLPAKIDDICLFSSNENGDFKATIKEFIGQTAETWKVKKYHPKEAEFTLKKRDWPKCQVVVGWYRRR